MYIFIYMWSFFSKIKCGFIKYCSFHSSCCNGFFNVDVDNSRKQTDEDIELNTCCFVYRKSNYVHDT